MQDRKWFLQNSGLGNFKQKPENTHDAYKKIGVEKTIKVKLTTGQTKKSALFSGSGHNLVSSFHSSE